MKRLALALAAIAAALAAVAAATAADGTRHAVYALTNSPTGNAVVAFARTGDGSLVPSGTYATGGLGGPLGSGHAVVVSHDGRYVAAVNAGSGSIGRFDVAADGSLALTGTIQLGAGAHPLDLDASLDQRYLYVLVDGFHRIDGFEVGPDGGLTPIASVPVPSGSGGLAAS